MEEFGAEIGTFNEGKIPVALRRLGFKRAFDLNTGADFTVMEESEELIARIKKNENLPLFSSCCPAWYQYVEKHYPAYVKNLSTCKSPNEMFGALVKHHFCKNDAVKPENLKVVAIMPCTAKKHEIIKGSDVDLVLSTREFASLIKMKNIDYKNLKEEKFDNPGGEYSGAALIFGSTGGVTEAAIRTAIYKLTGKNADQIEIKQVRQSPGIKEASLSVGDLKLDVCVVHGLANAYKVMDDIIAGRKKYHFVEVMACPGGCVNGGGQPFVDYSDINVCDVIAKRAAGLYKNDSNMKLRSSHDSTIIKGVYGDFLKDPQVAHKYLHHHFDKKK
jgi:iron-only hydrogenase group A